MGQMTDNTDNIIQMMDVYTNQIERYETLSTWYASFNIVCILAVILFAVFFIEKKNINKNTNKEIDNCILSCLFLIIPSITISFLYVFAMNMRKVALYRGYLSFLENQWNLLTGKDIMLFDSHIIRNFYSPLRFWINGAGPVIMAVFIILSITIGFGLSVYFEEKLQTSKIKSGLRFTIGLLGIICILFAGICCYYLSINDAVMNAVTIYCETFQPL